MKNFEWIKYHNFSKKLYDNEEEEYTRSAISRDYYACFNLSKKYLIEQKQYLPTHNSRSHTQVSQILQKSKNRKETLIGKRLNYLRKIRNVADYDSDNNSSKLIQKSKYKYKEFANEIIKTLKELEKEN